MTDVVQCDHCGTPIAEKLPNGEIRIIARHHGVKHVSRFKPTDKQAPVKVTGAKTLR